jgi:two-component system KDP operon response regulator KdpE
VTKQGHVVKLTGREYDMFRLLAVNAGRVVTHNQILAEIWGQEAIANIHYLRVFMMRLRRKIEDDPDAPRYLQTESGIGYRLVAE